MINNLNFNIQIDLQGLSEKNYFLILNLFAKNICDSDLNQTISLKELNDILYLSSRKFLTKSIEYPEFNDGKLDMNETNIEIIG